MNYTLTNDNGSLIFTPDTRLKSVPQLFEMLPSSRKIDKIVVHCSATKATSNVTIHDVRKWHTDKGWSDIGYHFFIELDGAIKIGRDINKAGAHVLGHNAHTIGVCYAGGYNKNMEAADTRTIEQKKSMLLLISKLKELHAGASVCGHRDYPKVAKACPCFDAIPEYN